MNRALIDAFHRLLREVHPDHARDFTCDECSEVLDAFAELVVRGFEVSELFPLVRQHVDHCDRCRSKFHTLLAKLRLELDRA